jgi:CHASE3 domain sensor protein
MSYIKDAETSQRGYLLTSQKSYLQPYENSLPLVEKRIEEIRKLTADNPNQQRRIENLEPHLFYESLAKFGILILGKQETIRFTTHEQNYKALNAVEKIYRKVC